MSLRALASLLTLAAISLTALCASPAAAATCLPAFGDFGGQVRPAACWRPYSAASPFNQLIPASPRIGQNSSAVVNRMVSYGPLQNLHAGDAGTTLDAGRPMYFSDPGDPIFTIHCTEAWGRCSIEGYLVRIPDAARVPQGEDKHLTVVEPGSGWEYDFWGVTSKPAGGGTIDIRWGGRTKIGGLGMGSDAVAAQTATMAGVLRAEELAGAQIDHALAIFVRCDSGKFVYPATKTGLACSQIGQSNTNAPAMGTRFQLNMSDREIDALSVPAWRKPLLRAMARYGMYVIDTGGTWGIVQESGLASTSFGAADPWENFAQSVGAAYWEPDARYAMNIRDGIDWGSRLRVIDPCVTQRTC